MHTDINLSTACICFQGNYCKSMLKLTMQEAGTLSAMNTDYSITRIIKNSEFGCHKASTLMLVTKTTKVCLTMTATGTNTCSCMHVCFCYMMTQLVISVHSYHKSPWQLI